MSRSNSINRRDLLKSTAPAALAALTGVTLLQRAEAAPGYAGAMRATYARLAPEFDRVVSTPSCSAVHAEYNALVQEFRKMLRPVTEHVAQIARECKAEIPANDDVEFSLMFGMLLIDTIVIALDHPEDCVVPLR